MSKSLREKIGSLICPRILGDRQEWECFDFPQASEYLKAYPPETFIVMRGDKMQTPELLRWVESDVVKQRLLFCSDVEEGPGQQLIGATRFPPMMALGATRDAKFAYELGKSIAEESQQLGIRWILGPVLDLARDARNPVIGSRSLGSDAKYVEALGLAFVRGVEDVGGIATIKHFPGHGATPVDSHDRLPTVELSLNELRDRDLAPFFKCIEARVGSVMMGHLAVPALEPDPNRPASLSPRIVRGLLRGDLGYQGLVVTDALIMGGVKGNYEPDSLGFLALEAGNDILMMPENPLRTAQYLEKQVEQGKLTESRLDESIQRLHRIRERQSRFSSPASPDFAQKLARTSLTLLDRSQRFKPWKYPEKISIRYWNETKDGDTLSRDFESLLQKKRVQISPTGRELFVIFSDNRAWRGRAGLSEESVKEITAALEASEDALIFAFCSPFAVLEFVEKAPMFLAYGYSPYSLDAAVSALAGEFFPAGRLPISMA